MNRWSTDSDSAWHMMHVSVDNLLHRLQARFSSVRILLCQANQLKRLIFLGHRFRQKNLDIGHLVPLSIKKLYKDLTENNPIHRTYRHPHPISKVSHLLITRKGHLIKQVNEILHLAIRLQTIPVLSGHKYIGALPLSQQSFQKSVSLPL